MNKRLRQAFKVNKESFKSKRPIIRAILGNGKGVVETSRANYVYARTTDGNIVTVLNKRVANIDGLAVFIGFTEEEPWVQQILGEFNAYNIIADTQLPNHAESHKWPNNDTVFVQAEQFTPWLVLPYSGTSVQLYGGIAYTLSGAVYTPTQYVDMQSYVPTSGAYYALLGLGATGGMVIQQGDLRTSISVLVPNDIPIPVSGTFPLAAIRLKAGQSVISKTASVRDIIDLRWSGYSVLSSSSSSSGSLIWVYQNGVLVLANAEQVDFTGTGVTVTSSGTRATVNITAGTGSGGGGGGFDGYGVTVQKDGIFQVSGTVLNFLNNNLYVNVSGTIADVVVSGSSSSGGIGVDGWISYSTVTPTRESADDPTYVMYFSGEDLTGLIGAGMRLKWTQNSTVRYGIATAISFSTGTSLTLYGGTDYDVDDTASFAISNFNYSPVKSPLGFPLNPLLWTVEVQDTTQRSQASPTQNQWYNLGSQSIDIPIGSWLVEWKVAVQSLDSNSGFGTVQGTLSTGSNSNSDSDFQVEANVQFTGPTTENMINTVQIGKHLILAAKMTYYFNTRTRDTGLSTIYNRNDLVPSILRATCAYL